ncbi:MAG: Uma2 family endonuclease [Chloroflexota bacterium]|nr:Uma2 family endonuclease [Chloroflexota bacterium]
MATVQSPPEQRILLRNVKWETYERLLADLADSAAPRLTFDRGTLEIMSPTAEHEKHNRRLAQLVTTLADELGLEAEDLGSTTFKRADLARGFEPDSCFYVQHEGRIRGREQLDLISDPPPDLVIEVDIISPSLDKLPLYARLGVPEVWRYDGSTLTIFRLGAGAYHEAADSAVLPGVTSADLTRLMAEGRGLGRTAWLRRVRAWVRGARPR